MTDPATTLDGFIGRLFEQPDLLRMGHGQRLADHNLGLGWLYYALGRILRPERAVVIGSYRGFAPSVIARALNDNQERGEVHFIDPSFADGFWADPGAVEAHFDALGTPNVRHHRHTTQSFAADPAYAGLGAVGLLMVDGLHTAAQACYDYLAFLPKLDTGAITLFHDSTVRRTSTFYGEDRAYQHSVCDLMAALRADPGLELFTLPVASGLTLVQGRPGDPEGLRRRFPGAEAGGAPESGARGQGRP
ncbi:class I SAM-dependent methyltransferase [Alkalilimnicola ehrlichii MLHE-1]|uniref:Class I SAM-dependent methyltransferase n=1 Tax=Alkalilimnicola ehrlichii (strain ATCC BAA-1101 / DSM 17681 / MLHE-1) TaxID=187272 RepID=Q0A637_ALKEH|nr:class I SAM-dependent methyltransferase [Alkalilimnicola ehrlichii]ABI57700.1 hypothetical protein Mlg_2360 [Alkalilimnicola ehrlichii MLHE-1]